MDYPVKNKQKEVLHLFSFVFFIKHFLLLLYGFEIDLTYDHASPN